MSYQSKERLVVYAKCPYYKSEFEKSITCVDGSDSGITYVTKFDAKEDKSKHAVQCCYHYPNKCMLAEAFDRLY